MLTVVLFSCNRIKDTPPNILFIISDDQSFPHASAYGYEGIYTPSFDRIAQQGILFTNAHAQAPGCSPSRASILTGLHIWQLGEAGSHGAGFDPRYKVFPDILEENGYTVGYTGKGWGPGDWEVLGRSRNPVGPDYNKHSMISPEGTSRVDYYANFRSFLKQRKEDEPFFFWFGGSEPHRTYRYGQGIDYGIDTSQIEMPPFLPNAVETKTDMADYLMEIQWFDQQTGRALDMLEDRGMLDNTLVIFTADQGMPFPKAKATLYNYGTHVPLAAMWKKKLIIPGIFEQPVGLINWMAAILETAGLNIEVIESQLGYQLSGESMWKILENENNEPVFSGRERHSSARWNNLPYSSRSIRKGNHLLMYNYFPERWPAGAPERINAHGNIQNGYDDVDDSPTLLYLLENQHKPAVKPYFEAFAQKKPQVELYDLRTDPGCMINLALQEKILADSLKQELLDYLEKTRDPRIPGDDIFDHYPRRKGEIREFPVPDWVIETNRK